MTVSATRTIEKTDSLPLLQRIAGKDTTAVNECVEAYGNFIWALAKRFTDSTEEAEAAAQEIFLDIWRYSLNAERTPSDESRLIALIAKLRLLGYLQAKRTKIYDEHRETTNKGRERTREANELYQSVESIKEVGGRERTREGSEQGKSRRAEPDFIAPNPVRH